MQKFNKLTQKFNNKLLGMVNDLFLTASGRHFLRCITALALWTIATVSAAETSAELKPFNVKDFGAKGDGVTDDTVAINAAIVAAQKMGSGSVVTLPSGR